MSLELMAFYLFKYGWVANRRKKWPRAGETAPLIFDSPSRTAFHFELYSSEWTIVFLFVCLFVCLFTNSYGTGNTLIKACIFDSHTFGCEWNGRGKIHREVFLNKSAKQLSLDITTALPAYSATYFCAASAQFSPSTCTQTYSRGSSHTLLCRWNTHADTYNLFVHEKS